jgi:hypothetical protein
MVRVERCTALSRCVLSGTWATRRNETLPMCSVRTQEDLARPEGFEPPTPTFVALYSIQLSYGRACRRNCTTHLVRAKKRRVGALPEFWGRDLTTTNRCAKSARTTRSAASRSEGRNGQTRNDPPPKSPPRSPHKCARPAPARRPPLPAPSPKKIRARRTPRPADTENNVRGEHPCLRSCFDTIPSTIMPCFRAMQRARITLRSPESNIGLPP